MTDWKGSLSVAGGGRIVGATGWGFDQPEDGLSGWDGREVRWRSETAGDWDGIVVELEGAETVRLTLTSGPATFTFSPDDLKGGPLVVDAGGVGQRVEVERDPGPDQPRAVSFSYETGPFRAGTVPEAYVVRVTQQDGHVAWSSPVFLKGG